MAPVTLIKPRRVADERGWFCETYRVDAAAALGIRDVFVQDNHSLSRKAGTVRGLHFQLPPDGQAKLVRCLRGRMLDHVVDIRRGSPTYGRTASVELSEGNGWQLYIPVGFAHGFVTLEPDCEVAYKVSAVYAPASDAGIRFDDPALGLDWVFPAGDLSVSPKDRGLPALAAFGSPFAYDGEPLPASLH